MTALSVQHSTFTLERTYPVPVRQVFAAWADPAIKGQWFASGGAHTLDFTVGGLEIASGQHDGHTLAFTTTYLEIRPDQRITYTSTMTSDGTVTTASLTTVEFATDGDGTRLTLTEHGAYLDGAELPEWREEGTAAQLDSLGANLEKSSAEPHEVSR